MYKSIIKPTLVLMLIVAVVSGILAFTYNFAGIADLGKGVSPEELDAMRPEVLPTATKLIHTDVELEDADFLGAYVDETGNGVAIHLNVKAYGKEPMKILVGIDKDEKIAGIKIISHSETNGIGSKVDDAAYLAQYIGKKSPIKDGADIDIIASATKTSVALVNGVNHAFDIYEKIKGEL